MMDQSELNHGAASMTTSALMMQQTDHTQTHQHRADQQQMRTKIKVITQTVQQLLIDQPHISGEEKKDPQETNSPSDTAAATDLLYTLASSTLPIILRTIPHTCGLNHLQSQLTCWYSGLQFHPLYTTPSTSQGSASASSLSDSDLRSSFSSHACQVSQATSISSRESLLVFLVTHTKHVHFVVLFLLQLADQLTTASQIPRPNTNALFQRRIFELAQYCLGCGFVIVKHTLNQLSWTTSDPAASELETFRQSLQLLRSIFLTRLDRFELIYHLVIVAPFVMNALEDGFEQQIIPYSQAVPKKAASKLGTAPVIPHPREVFASVRIVFNSRLVKYFFTQVIKYLPSADRNRWMQSKEQARFSLILESILDIFLVQIRKCVVQCCQLPSASTSSTATATSVVDDTITIDWLIDEIIHLSRILSPFGHAFDDSINQAYQIISTTAPVGPYSERLTKQLNEMAQRSLSITRIAATDNHVSRSAWSDPELFQTDPLAVIQLQETTLIPSGGSTFIQTNLPSVLSSPFETAMGSLHGTLELPMSYPALYRKYEFNLIRLQKIQQGKRTTISPPAVLTTPTKTNSPTLDQSLSPPLKSTSPQPTSTTLPRDMSTYSQSILRLLREIFDDAFVALGGSAILTSGFQVVATGSFARGEAATSGVSDLNVCVMLQEDESTNLLPTTFLLAFFSLISHQLQALASLGYPAPRLDQRILMDDVSPFLINTVPKLATSMIEALKTIATKPFPPEAHALLTAQQHIWAWSPIGTGVLKRSDQLVNEFNRLVWVEYLLKTDVNEGEHFATVYSQVTSPSNLNSPSRRWYMDLTEELNDLDSQDTPTLASDENQPDGENEYRSSQTSSTTTTLASTISFISPEQLLAQAQSVNGLHPLVRVRLERISLFFMKYHLAQITASNPFLTTTTQSSSTIHLHPSLLQPLILWINDFMLFQGWIHASIFDSIQALLAQKKIHPRFAAQLTDVVTFFHSVRNLGVEVVDVDQKSDESASAPVCCRPPFSSLVPSITLSNPTPISSTISPISTHLLIPLMHSYALFATEAKAWGQPTQISSFSTSTAVSTTAYHSDLTRPEYDPLMAACGDWVKSRSAFVVAQEQAANIMAPQESKGRFQSHIDALSIRITDVIQRLAHDFAASITETVTTSPHGPDALVRSIRKLKDYFHSFVQDLPTRYLFVCGVENHMDASGTNEATHQLFGFMTTWPIHSGGRVLDVVEEVNSWKLIHQLCQSNDNDEQPSSVTIHYNWSSLEELLEPASEQFPLTSGISHTLIAARSSNPPPYTVLTSSAVWIIPTQRLDVTLSPSHCILLQQYATNLLSDLIYGRSMKTFLTSLHSTQLREDTFQVVIPSGSILLADMVTDVSHATTHLLSQDELIQQNLRLLELQLDARCITLKFIESLLFCPREEGVHELIAIPIENNQPNANQTNKNDYPSSDWQKDTKYALSRSMISFPFIREQYECSHQHVHDDVAVNTCTCTQPMFLYQQSVETQRSGTLVLERVNVRSLLFCLDRMRDPLSIDAINELLNLDFKQVLHQWLKNLVRIERELSPTASTSDPIDPFNPPKPSSSGFTLPPLTIEFLMSRWEHIHSVLRQARSEVNDSATTSTGGNKRMMSHSELFQQIDRELFNIYDAYAWNYKLKDIADTKVDEADDPLTHESDEPNHDDGLDSTLGSFSGEAYSRFNSLPREYVPVKLGYLHQCDAPAHFVTKKPFYAILEEGAGDAIVASSPPLQDLLETTLPTMAPLYTNLRSILFRLRSHQSLFSPSKLQPHIYEMILNLTDWSKVTNNNQSQVKIAMPSMKKSKSHQTQSHRSRSSSFSDQDSTSEHDDSAFEPSKSVSTSNSVSTSSYASMYSQSTSTPRYSHQETTASTTGPKLSSQRSVNIKPITLVKQPSRKDSLVHPDSLWNTVSLCEIVRDVPLQHVHIPGCHLLTDAVLEYLINTSAGSLLSLDISGCKALLAPNDRISSLSSKCVNLNWLNVSDIDTFESIGPSSLKSLLFSSAPPFRKLTKLYANQCVNLLTIRIEAPFLTGLFIRDCAQLEKFSTGRPNKQTSTAPVSLKQAPISAIVTGSTSPPPTIFLQVDARGCHSLEKSPIFIAHEDYLANYPPLERAEQQHAALYAPSSKRTNSHVVSDANSLPPVQYNRFNGAVTAAEWGGWWMNEFDLSNYSPENSPRISSKKLEALNHLIIGPTARIINFKLNLAPSLVSLIIDSPHLQSLALRHCVCLTKLEIVNGLNSSLRELDLTSCHGVIDSVRAMHTLLGSAPMLQKLILDENIRVLEEEWNTLQQTFEEQNSSQLSQLPQENSAKDCWDLTATLLKYGPHVTFFSFLHSPLRQIAHDLQFGAVSEIRLVHHHANCGAQTKSTSPLNGLQPDNSSASPPSPWRTTQTLGQLYAAASATPTHENRSPNDIEFSPVSISSDLRSTTACFNELSIFEKDDLPMLALSSALREYGWMNTSIHTLSLTCSHGHDPEKPISATSMISSLTVGIGLPALVSCILSIPFLNHLYLEGHQLGNRNCAAILAAIGGYEQQVDARALSTLSTSKSSKDSTRRQSVADTQKRISRLSSSATSTAIPFSSSFSFVSEKGGLHPRPQLESLTLKHQALTEEFVAVEGPIHLFLETISSLNCLDLSHNFLRGAGLKSLGAVVTLVSKSVTSLSLLELNLERNQFDLTSALEFTHDIDAIHPNSDKRKSLEPSSTTAAAAPSLTTTKSQLTRLTLGCPPLIDSVVKRVIPVSVENWTDAIILLSGKVAKLTGEINRIEAEAKQRKKSKGTAAPDELPTKSKEQCLLERSAISKQCDEAERWYKSCKSFVHYGIVSSTTPQNSSYSQPPNLGYGSMAPTISNAASSPTEFTLMLDGFPVPSSIVELDPAEGGLLRSSVVSFERGCLYRISEAFYLRFLKQAENRSDDERMSPIIPASATTGASPTTIGGSAASYPSMSPLSSFPSTSPQLASFNPAHHSFTSPSLDAHEVYMTDASIAIDTSTEDN